MEPPAHNPANLSTGLIIQLISGSCSRGKAVELTRSVLELVPDPQSRGKSQMQADLYATRI